MKTYKLYIILAIVLTGCCDECIKTDYIYFRLVTQTGDDYLVKNNLNVNSVQLYILNNQDTVNLYIYSNRDYNDSTDYYAEINKNSSSVFIAINNQVKDTLTFDLYNRVENCCARKETLTTIRSMEFDGKRKIFNIDNRHIEIIIE